jgi:iron(III) transport system permease protein
VNFIPTRRERTSGLEAIPLVCSWLMLSVVVALLAFVLYMTFVPGLPTEPGFTLRHWSNVASSRLLTRVVPNTAIVGFGTIFIGAFFALPLAWLLNRTNLPFRTTFTTVVGIVPVIPGFILAMGWIMLLDERIGLINKIVASVLGLSNVALSVKDSPWGIAWVLGLILTAPIFFLVAGPLSRIDPSLEEAASVTGMRQLTILRRVTLPLVWPGILGGVIYTFMTAVSIFEIPALLGAASGRVPVLATEIFYSVRPGGPMTATFAYGAAGVYGTLLAVPSLLALYLYLRALQIGERYQVITGKGYRARETDLGPFAWVAVAFVVLYLSLAVGMPILILVWASLMPVLQMPSREALTKLSFANYHGLLEGLGGVDVIWNTVLVVVCVALLVSFFSFMISWVVVRTQVRSRKTIDMLAMLPHAIPSLAFAFALAMIAILASRWLPWLPLSGTLGIIMIAHLITRVPYGTRVMNSALGQVHRELEEIAQVCGTRTPTIMRRVVLPLVRPSVVYLAVWTAMLSFQEVTMALFLSGPHNNVLSVSIWALWEAGSLGTAAAGAVAMVFSMGVLMFGVLKFAGGSATGIVGRETAVPPPSEAR